MFDSEISAEGCEELVYEFRAAFGYHAARYEVWNDQVIQVYVRDYCRACLATHRINLEYPSVITATFWFPCMVL